MFKFIIRAVMPLSLLLYCLLAEAGGPVNFITVALQAGATTTVPRGETGTANYLVTLNAAVPAALTMSLTNGLPAGVTQVTTGALACGGVTTCTSSFNVNPGGQCCLKLLMTSSNMTLGSNSIAPLVQTTPTPTYSGLGDTLNVTVTSAPAEVTLTASPSTLALSVNCPLSSSCTTKNAALTGNPRQITITNTSTTTIAYNVNYTTSTLPAGTTITPASCGDIAANNGQCILTITPEQTPSATPYLLNPTPITLTIVGDNTNILNPTANILTYGSVYGGGYVYSIDDTYAHYPEGVSIGGKVATLTDRAEPYINSGHQATSIIWSSNGAGFVSADASFDIIPSIAETVTTNDNYATAQTAFNNTYSNNSTYPFPSSGSFAACAGATDGACNSGNILALYDATYSSINYITTNYSIACDPHLGGTGGCTLSAGKTGLNDYAAGLCAVSISGHNDWYLPAICEMDSVDGGLVCTSTQSMVGSLSALIGDPGATTPSTSCLNGVNCLAGYYWSSTETSGGPQGGAWSQYVASGGGSLQGIGGKGGQLGVRCSRALTI